MPVAMLTLVCLFLTASSYLGGSFIGIKKGLDAVRVTLDLCWLLWSTGEAGKELVLKVHI